MKYNLEKLINRQAVEVLLSDLIKIHSPYFNEDKIMKYVYDWLNKRKLNPKYHHYNEDKITNFSGVNIIGNLKGSQDGPRILLNGHLDTVNICEGWTKEPLISTIKGNRMYGLGALDMKSGCVAILLAINAFKSIVKDFKGEIRYSFVSDEEGPYGLGTNYLIEDGYLNEIDVAIVTEPSSGFCHTEFPCLCLGARGGYNYRVDFKGRSSHAANPEGGVSAIVDSAKVMLELKNSNMIIDEKLGKGSICIIESGGGGEACSVADKAHFTVFRHIVRGENKETVKQELMEAVKRANIKSDVSFKFRDAPSSESQGFEAYMVEKDNLYSQSFIKSIKDICMKEPSIDYFSSIGDFNYLGGRKNIHTLVFGPNGGNYHSADEYVYIDTVIKTSKIIVSFLLDNFRI